MAGFPLRKWWAAQIVIRDPSVPIGSKVLFARLLEYHNSTTGLCYPGQTRLGIDLGVDPRTIRNWLKPLVKRSYVTCIPKGGLNGSNASEIWLPRGKMEYDQAARAF